MTNVDRGEKTVTVLNEETSMSIGKAISIARGYHKEGVFTTAEEIYLQILAQKPDQPEVLNYLGVLRFQIGFPDDGIQLLLAALKINPNYVDALNNLGNILRRQNHLEDAEKVYRRAIEITPDFSEAHMNLAALLYMSDRYEEAIVEARLVAQYSPQIFEANAITVNTIELNSMVSVENPAEVAKSYLQTIERKTFDVSVHENLARILWNLNREEEAIKAYRRWIEMEPDNPEPRHHLAACTGVDVPARASDEYVKELFDRFANSFDKKLTKLKYAAPSLVAEAVQEQFGTPESNLTVLDAGCGTGLCGIEIRPFAQRLVGVDLSKKMLDKARERQIYDELHAAELTAFLASSPGSYDVILSADTLIYFGDLVDVMQAASRALKSNGRFVFTVEKCEATNVPEGYVLQSHGRYQHSSEYVKSAIERSGMELVSIREVILRLEGRSSVAGWLVVAFSKA